MLDAMVVAFLSKMHRKKVNINFVFEDNKETAFIKDLPNAYLFLDSGHSGWEKSKTREEH